MLSANKDMDKNLKDSEGQSEVSNGTSTLTMSLTLPYTKTNKLVTALYMVTDIMDAEEPIRNKLRTLGMEIISDMHSPILAKTIIAARIDQVMSFLSIASAMNFISEMNCEILKKEFLKLKRSLLGELEIKPTWLAEFLGEGFPPLLDKEGNEGRFLKNSPHPSPLLVKERGRLISKGHTNLGVQKASTLLKAIKDVSDRMPTSRAQDFDILKKQRRDEIISFIRKNGGSSTITDIKTNVQGSLTSFSEKTLQRELMSMTKDGVLNKTGEKRWSRYFVR